MKSDEKKARRKPAQVNHKEYVEGRLEYYDGFFDTVLTWADEQHEAHRLALGGKDLVKIVASSIESGDIHRAVHASIWMVTNAMQLSTIPPHHRTLAQVSDLYQNYSNNQANRRRGSKVTTDALKEVDRLVGNGSKLSRTAACRRVAADGKLNPHKIGWNQIYNRWKEYRGMK